MAIEISLVHPTRICYVQMKMIVMFHFGYQIHLLGSLTLLRLIWLPGNPSSVIVLVAIVLAIRFVL